jgi:hypothetical protein
MLAPKPTDSIAAPNETARLFCNKPMKESDCEGLSQTLLKTSRVGSSGQILNVVGQAFTLPSKAMYANPHTGAITNIATNIKTN